MTTGCRSWASIGTVAQAVSQALDLEVEAVQMHRVGLRAEVDDAPPHLVTELIRQPLGGGPGESVDREGETRLGA